ncbi:cobyrinate a,c-diamide synthase [Flammeovirga kamogawensis]|uniref:Cobyrinate a,c-diamide synthase n=1 Tax=Flammeovirga kamogawensis TaxID=373891 RepID=A0ABX8H2L3_9BACT|nr:cobyrinate a,c-diamide synthase [Flammeovirga kamogawensis]MBB6460347.1 cobyrinic acid a,c-diamide synthase [Flammeovirga kamogawensis]QWG10156.1 cobyrinate a,c-diamide synthase [Flammeovirga kamogawensis]TRX64608.1 cobyrinate a,c-diamide synthase [Flammeovirga kamogawensis]
MHKSSFIIAAPTSNSGKTTITLGLLRALKNRGKEVQPFKSGPDYIDPKFHGIACGKTGVNLDLFMMTEQHLKETYLDYIATSEIQCIEGVMGLFDGAKKAERSTAELAKKLNLPIIFVVDAKAVAYSVAPLLYGFKNFDPSLNIVGVIFNRVNTKSHYKFLQEASEDVGIKALGYVPFLEDCKIQSRHLGLSIANLKEYDKKITAIAKQIEKTVHLNQLLDLTTYAETTHTKQKAVPPIAPLTIGVAKDEAFNFSYSQNINALKKIGKVVFFSPIKDEKLPQTDVLYFPGGYPECYVKNLAENKAMLSAIKEYAENEGVIIAECGGMMYLGKNMIDQNGDSYPMANVFSFSSSMKAMKLHLGYRTIHLDEYTFKGHEFHYSEVYGDENIETVGQIFSARNQEVPTKIYKYKNVLASYIHLYFGEANQFKSITNYITDKTLQL